MKWLVLVGFIMSLNVAHASRTSGDPNLSNTRKKANCSHQSTKSRRAKTTLANHTKRSAPKRRQYRRVH